MENNNGIESAELSMREKISELEKRVNKQDAMIKKLQLKQRLLAIAVICTGVAFFCHLCFG